MWPFDISRRKAFKKAQDRDLLFKSLKEAAKSGDRVKINSPLLSLLDRHLGDSLLPPVLAETVGTLAKNDLHEGISLALYLLGRCDYGDENKNSHYDKIRRAVAEKSFGLMERLDKNNTEDMADAAMLAGVITGAVDAGSDAEARALRLWNEVMDVLSAKDIKNFALAAACNASCGMGSRALSEAAIEKMEKALAHLAQSDKATATALAKAFAQKCEEFDGERAPFKQRVSALARKLS
jgi:hypothetical protein